MTTWHEPAATREAGPLAILAAGGAIPVEVARAAASAGRRVLVIALEGEADERLKSFDYVPIKWGQIGRIERLATDYGARDLVMIGSVSGRPDFRKVGLDFGTLRLLPRILKGMVGGDDAVLTNFLRYFEERGFRMVGAHEVAPDLVASPGHMAGPKAGDGALADGRVAMRAALAIGALDIGQAAVAVGGHVIAVEAAEGTDAMLERVEGLRARGRVKWPGRAGVLAKCSKPQQDLRVDMPTIGPRTVEALAKAGLAGVLIEPGRVMIAQRAETVAAAERTGTFIVAAAAADEPGGAA